jgi:hypothetical protein
MWSSGSIFGASVGNSLGQDIAAGGETGTRWPVPTWRFGLRVSDDRGDM